MSLRPEELLCYSLFSAAISELDPTFPYSYEEWSAASSTLLQSLLPPSSACRSSSPGPSPGRPARQAGWREKELGSALPGWEARPEFLSFPQWLLQDFSVKVFTGWVGLFYQSQILANQFSVRSFSPCSPRPEPADLTSPNPAQPCPTHGPI